MPVNTYHDRMVAERGELLSKLSRLDAFILTATFRNLEPTDRALLEEQGKYMALYSAALGERIKRSLATITKEGQP